MQEQEKIAKMDALLFAINLETASLQLQLVDSCAKYNELYNVACSKKGSLKRNKLNRERCFIKDVLRRTLLELLDDGMWSVLHEAMVFLQKSALYLIQLRSSYDELSSSLETLSIQLMKTRQESTINLRHVDLNIALLKDSIRETLMNTNMQLNYVEKWLKAREESVELQHRIKLNLPPSMATEERVHQQVIQFYELQTKEREKSLEYWMSRYTKDIEDINGRLKKETEKFKKAVERRTELQKLYDLHQGEMRAWLNFKQERSARLAREERSRLAATRIQAWWRGVMVRRCIGVFKQLKNPKKPLTKAKKK